MVVKTLPVVTQKVINDVGDLGKDGLNPTVWFEEMIAENPLLAELVGKYVSDIKLPEKDQALIAGAAALVYGFLKIQLVADNTTLKLP